VCMCVCVSQHRREEAKAYATEISNTYKNYTLFHFLYLSSCITRVGLSTCRAARIRHTHAHTHTCTYKHILYASCTSRLTSRPQQLFPLPTHMRSLSKSTHTHFPCTLFAHPTQAHTHSTCTHTLHTHARPPYSRCSSKTGWPPIQRPAALAAAAAAAAAVAAVAAATGAHNLMGLQTMMQAVPAR